MSSITKGDYYMKKAADELIALGYMVEKAKKVRWAAQDFWGCWDIIAIYKEKPEVLPMPYGLMPIRFIQVSTKYLSQKSREYQDAIKNFPTHQNTSKEYWHAKEKGKPFEVTVL